MAIQDVGSRSASQRPEREDLRRRLIHERQVRGWSVPELSRRLASAGVRLKPQDLYNVESPPPGRSPRVVKVDELAAFAEVYDMPIAALLVSPEEAFAPEVAALIEEVGHRRNALVHAAEQLGDSTKRLLLLLPDADSASKLLQALKEIQNNLVRLVDVGIELEDDLRSGAVRVEPTSRISTRRRSRGKHQQAP